MIDPYARCMLCTTVAGPESDTDIAPRCHEV
jgi:hypothetical protein